jgi:hypothetical protein
LIGREYQLNAEGRAVPVREAIRALVRLEVEERDRLARFCSLAINAGLMEKQIAAAERFGGQLAELIRSLLGEPALALTYAQQAAFLGVIRRHLALLSLRLSTTETGIRCKPLCGVRTPWPPAALSHRSPARLSQCALRSLAVKTARGYGWCSAAADLVQRFLILRRLRWGERLTEPQ